MNRKDVIRMAQEAGWSGLYTTYNEPTGKADWQMVKESVTVPVTMEQIERFAELVAAAEREACAKLCDDRVDAEYATGKVDHNEMGWTQACAEAIRARSEKRPVKSYCGGKPNYCTPEVTPEVTTEVTGDVGACVTCGAPKGEWLVDAVNISQERVDETAKCKHEPFIYVREDNEKPFGGFEHCSEADAGAFPVYTAPPKAAEWVGLTDEEKHQLNDALNLQGRFPIIETIEAKLKEKNT